MEKQITMEEVKNFINCLSEVDQKIINKYIEDRLEKSVENSLKFRVGQRVSWRGRKFGKKIFGCIDEVRNNMAIITEDGGSIRWKVNFEFLRDASEKTN